MAISFTHVFKTNNSCCLYIYQKLEGYNTTNKYGYNMFCVKKKFATLI